MAGDYVFKAHTPKTSTRFVSDLAATAAEFGMIVHNEDKMDMAHTFGSHGVEISEGFDLHMIQICKPDKAAASLQANPERAILMPKFIMTFTQNGATQIRFFYFSRENIRVLVDDDSFPASLEQSYAQIIAMINKAIER